MGFAGIKSSRNNKRRWVNMFEKETAGLCCLVAFFTTHPMFINDKTNIADGRFSNTATSPSRVR